MAFYLLVAGLTFTDGDRSVFATSAIDARYVYSITGMIGLGAAFGVRRLRLPWLLALLVCTLGRAATLLVIGSPTISSRTAELRSALGWFTMWILGSFPVIAMQASDIIRGRIDGDDGQVPR